MYRFAVDEVNKIIHIEVSGFLERDEILAFVNDKRELFKQYFPKEYSLLIDAQRLDAISQDCIQLYQEVMEAGLDWAKKIAVVNGNRMVTQMQMKRIESSAKQKDETKIAIMRFKSIPEALRYIKE
jgi:CO dehydrogenase/acetyl-CoA synthase delta subunit